MKIILLLLTAAFTIQSNVTAQIFDAVWASRFQTVLDSTVSANNIKGASVSVLAPGHGLWTGVSGISSPGVPVTADMRFGIASNTKLFIAAVMAKLQEQSVLSLDDHLYQWLPAYPNVDSTATIRQLLSHQSGIADYLSDNVNTWRDSIWADTSRFWTPQEMLATIGPPLFAPGHGYSYSGINYILAGLIIDTATGMSWVQNLHNIIFNPLNMDSTFVGAFEAPNGPVAHEWDDIHGEIINSPMTSEFSTASVEGALLSTSGEMAQWYNALFSGAIIADSSLQEVINFDPSSLYGLGLNVGSYFLHPFYYHVGWMPIGYRSVMHYDVQTKSVICLLTNGGVTDLSVVIFPLLNVFYDEYPKQQNDAGISSIINPWENSCSATVTPSVSLINYGSNALTSVTINYKIDAGAVSTFYWTGNLSTGNAAAVTLPAITPGNGIHAFTTYTSSPNGVAEGYAYNDTASSVFIVNIAAALIAPLSESFEGSVFPPSGWTKNSNSTLQWGQTSLASFTGNSSAAKGNYNDQDIGTIYDLDMPELNISGITNPVLEFQYAYTNFPGYGDSLLISISTDCGVTWQSLFYKGGDDLKTAPSSMAPFYPAASEWKQEIISLAAYTGDLLIRFRDINGWSNNLFIDDVSINQSTSINAIALLENEIFVYPNPASDKISIEGLPQNSEIQISDVTGKILWIEKTSSAIAGISLNQFPKGVYFLMTEKGVKKIVKL